MTTSRVASCGRGVAPRRLQRLLVALGATFAIVAPSADAAATPGKFCKSDKACDKDETCVAATSRCAKKEEPPPPPPEPKPEPTPEPKPEPPPPPTSPPPPAAKPAEAAPTPQPSVDPTGVADESYRGGGEHRVINNHAYIAPSLATSSITNAYLAFTQGFGMYSFDRTSAATGKQEKGRLFLYGQGFLGSIGIVNRVAIDLSARGLAAVGGDLQTVLAVGALADLNVGGMPKVRLFTLDKIGLQATVGLGAYYVRVLQIIPENLVDKALNSVAGNKAVGDAVVQQSSLFRLAPTLALAEGWGPLGLQLSLAPQFAVAGDDPKGTALAFGAHLGFDARNLSRYAPVSITGEYQLLANFATTPASKSSTFIGGLYYSGRRDFNFGATVAVAPGIGPDPGDGSPRPQDLLLQANLVMQYYF